VNATAADAGEYRCAEYKTLLIFLTGT